MPQQSKADTLFRQWELIQRIPARAPGKTVVDLKADLAEAGFEVTKRTVQRDLDDLSVLFPLQCNDKGTPYGWHWQEEFSMELPALSVSDAQSLLLIKDLLRPLVPQALSRTLENRFDTAKRMLEALASSNVLARWPDKVRAVPNALALQPPRVDPAVLSTLQEAVLNERQCEVLYQKPLDDVPGSQTLHPLGLLQRGPVTYLVATAYHYQEPRLYAIHRFKGATQLDVAIQKPQGFTLDDYVATGAPQFGSGDRIHLVAKVADNLGRILKETPLSEDMQLEESADEWWTVTATVQDTWQLRWWIKSQGADMVVRQPVELRRALLNELKRSLLHYRDRSLNR